MFSLIYTIIVVTSCHFTKITMQYTCSKHAVYMQKPSLTNELLYLDTS